MVLRLTIFFLAIVSGLIPAYAQSKRVALVIGNADYQHATKLATPARDAELMAGVLRKQGYEVISATNTTRAGMEAALRSFESALRTADAGLFYFAGHGIQIGEDNYLVPVDGEASAVDETGLVPLAGIQRRLHDERKPIILIFDACRADPFSTAGTSQSATRSTVVAGLAREAPAPNMLIAFATSPGTIANDGDGENSVFTKLLAEELTGPPREVEASLREVSAKVSSATAGRQLPWSANNLRTAFYFAGHGIVDQAGHGTTASAKDPSSNVAEGTEAARRAAMPSQGAAEAARWAEKPAGLSKGSGVRQWDCCRSRTPAEMARLCAQCRDLLCRLQSGCEGTGAIGEPKTRTATRTGPPEPPDAKVIMQVQRELSRLGCSIGSFDGIWGSQTQAALARFSDPSGFKLTAGEPPNWRVLAWLKSQQGQDCGRSGAGPFNDRINRFANLDAPDQAVTGGAFPVTLDLKEARTTEEKDNQAQVKVQPSGASQMTPDGRLSMQLDTTRTYWDIDIDLVAPGFTPNDGKWTRKLRLPRTGEPDAVRFVLSPLPATLGQKWITLRLWHEGRSLGSVSRPIDVHAPTLSLDDKQRTPPASGRRSEAAPSLPGIGIMTKSVPVGPVVQALTPIVLADRPDNRPVDLDVSIQYDNPEKLGSALLTIRTPQKGPPLTTRISTPPAMITWLDREYTRLVALGQELAVTAAAKDAKDAKGNKVGRSKESVIAAVKGIGNTIYREYLPEELKAIILGLEEKNQLTSIQITTNSPVIPWELVLPDKRGNGNRPEFFGIAFRLARWPVRTSYNQMEDPIHLLSFAELHALVPSYTKKETLPAQERELAKLKLSKGFRLHEPNFAAWRNLLSKRIDGVVHFAGHGDYAQYAPNLPLYSIRLADGALDPQAWRQIAKDATFGNPFFFFNACHVGGSRSSGGFVQGWGPVILSTGAGGFIGGQWPLIDEAAADFAEGFYEQVNASTSPGGIFIADVLRDVRRTFYKSGDPTYLAYALYGSANLRIATPAP